MKGCKKVGTVDDLDIYICEKTKSKELEEQIEKLKKEIFLKIPTALAEIENLKKTLKIIEDKLRRANIEETEVLIDAIHGAFTSTESLVPAAEKFYRFMRDLDLLRAKLMMLERKLL